MQRIAYGVSLVMLGGLALTLRASGLDPPSLWLDDQWVGIVVTRMSWGEFFDLRPPVPLGFVALLKASISLVGDPELGLQLVPMACAVAIVPAGAILVTRLTGRRSLGILAGALFAICPNLVDYAVATKQYSSDCLVSVLLLLIGHRLLDRWTRRRALALAGTSLAVLPFSFTSLLVAFPLLNLAALAAAFDAKKRGERTWPSLGIALGFNAALLAAYLLLLSGQANEEMRKYWSAYYLPLDSTQAVWEFITVNISNFVGGALPNSDLTWINLLLIPILIIPIVIHKRTRMVGVFTLVFYAQMLALSAMKLYPLGTGRTDIFSYPISILTLCLGLHVLAGYLRDARIPAAAFLIAAVVVSLLYAEPAAYGIRGGYKRAPCRDAELVSKLNGVLREGDALLIYPLGSFAVGYYGPWELELRPFSEYAHGFEVQIRRDHTRTLPGYSDPERLQPALTEFLAANRDRRVVLFSSFVFRPIFPWLLQAIAAEGYEAINIETTARGSVITFERR